MDYANILLDIIATLIREQKSHPKYTSDRLIEKLLSKIESNNSKISLEDLTLVNNLTKFIRDILNKKSIGEKFLPSTAIRYVTMELSRRGNIDGHILEVIVKDTLIPEEDPQELKSSLYSLKNKLYSAFTELELLDIGKNISISLKHGKTANAIMYLRNKLEELDDANSIADDAIISEITFNIEELEENIKNMTNNLKEKTVYKTGYKALSIATQGGLRSGDCVVVSALSHHNKTGFTIGISSGIMLLNEFFPSKKGLKPLVLHLSFEDPDTMTISKYYNTLVATFNDAPTDTPTIGEMAIYIQNKFHKSGAEFKMVYVDPTLWTYMDMTNYIKNLEANGYELKVVINDYLDKLPSTGLSTRGPTGSDRKELLRKARNFFGKRNILYITPWQMGPKANEMVANGLDPLALPKFAAGKSLYQGNSTLDTDIDVEILLSKGTYDEKWYQAVAIGKHRLETVISNENLKYFFYKFPDTGPIPLDEVTGKKEYAYRLSAFGTSDETSSVFAT